MLTWHCTIAAGNNCHVGMVFKVVWPKRRSCDDHASPEPRRNHWLPITFKPVHPRARIDLFCGASLSFSGLAVIVAARLTKILTPENDPGLTRACNADRQIETGSGCSSDHSGALAGSNGGIKNINSLHTVYTLVVVLIYIGTYTLYQSVYCMYVD